MVQGCWQGPYMKKPLVLGEESHGLYHVIKSTPEYRHGLVNSSFSSNVASFSFDAVFPRTKLSSANLWHCRLGHLPYHTMQHIDCVGSISEHTSSVCHICHLAKHHKNSFSSSAIKSKGIFEFIHVDIWAPNKYPTPQEYKYFLTIVDDVSRATWCHLLVHKSTTFSILQSFLSLVQTQFGVCVKIIRSDNGGEFCSTEGI